MFEANTRATGTGSSIWLQMKVPGTMASTDSAALRAVLVVEDEMMLRMRAVDMVEDAGFTSVEAVNADDALAILESRSRLRVRPRRADGLAGGAGVIMSAAFAL